MPNRATQQPSPALRRRILLTLATKEEEGQQFGVLAIRFVPVKVLVTGDDTRGAVLRELDLLRHEEMITWQATGVGVMVRITPAGHAAARVLRLERPVMGAAA